MMFSDLCEYFQTDKYKMRIIILLISLLLISLFIIYCCFNRKYDNIEMFDDNLADGMDDTDNITSEEHDYNDKKDNCKKKYHTFDEYDNSKIDWNDLRKNAYITFDGQHIAKPKDVYFPETLDDIKEIIKNNQGRKIRVSGGSHTFNDISISNDIIIKMFNMKNVLDLNENDKTVTVESGIILGELNLFLEKNDLSLHVLPAISYQSLGGVLATSSHGSNSSTGSMSSAIEEITMVLADGEVKTFNKNDDDFKAFNTSLGALGVIYSVKIRCNPIYAVDHINENYKK